jgi:hypothetical protein
MIDIIDHLAMFDGDDAIYSSERWTANCDAILARDPDAGGRITK